TFASAEPPALVPSPVAPPMVAPPVAPPYSVLVPLPSPQAAASAAGASSATTRPHSTWRRDGSRGVMACWASWVVNDSSCIWCPRSCGGDALSSAPPMVTAWRLESFNTAQQRPDAQAVQRRQSVPRVAGQPGRAAETDGVRAGPEELPAVVERPDP